MLFPFTFTCMIMIIVRITPAFSSSMTNSMAVAVTLVITSTVLVPVTIVIFVTLLLSRFDQSDCRQAESLARNCKGCLQLRVQLPGHFQSRIEGPSNRSLGHSRSS